MSTRSRVLVLLVVALGVLAVRGLAAPPTDAQGPARTDPSPGFIEQLSATLSFRLGTPQAIRIVPGGSAALFLRSGPRSFVRELIEQDAGGGAERVLARAEQLLGGADEKLSAEERARRERARLTARGIAGFDLSEDGKQVLIPVSDRLFVLDRQTGTSKEMASGGGFPLDARFSPDGRSIACVRSGDLHVIDVSTGTDRALTTGATSTLTRGAAEFVAQEEMGRREGYWWSPDSAMLAYQETDTSHVEVFHIGDPLHPEKPPDSWAYPRPGHPNAVVRLGLIGRSGGSTVWVDWDRQAFPYLASVTWRKEGPLTILVQNREQTEERLLAVDAQSGATRMLLEEKDAAWINLHQTTPRWLPDGTGFLWLSDRTGELRLELRAPDGRQLRWITPPGFGLGSLAGVEPGSKTVLVSASPDPTQAQVWRVPLSGGKPQALTTAQGLTQAVVARDGSASVWSESLTTGERIWSLRDRNDKETGRLRSVAEEPMVRPQVEFTELGPLGFRAAIVRPRNLVPGRRYPVLVDVYAGPGVQALSKQPWGFLLDQWMADHGFIVLKLDGRGTPGRGRDWERVIKGNLIDVALEDQVAGLQAAGARYPEMDLSRVGIWGWSFGGYFSAMAAMRRPDIYKAAIAGAPVSDWEYYDTHYTERYLGLPDKNPEAYRKSSVLTYASQLKVPLLVVHGTADDNVYFLHSLKIADALFHADRPYDFLVLPGFTHMVPDPAVQSALRGREIDFFITHLSPAQ